MPIQLNVPNINTGKPWSPTDDGDLKARIEKRMPVRHRDVIAAAEFLCRNGEEVRARLRELGYIRSRGNAADSSNRHKAKQTTTRGRKQGRARVAGGQKHEVSYEAKKTGKSGKQVKKAVKKGRQQPQEGWARVELELAAIVKESSRENSERSALKPQLRE